MHFNLYLFFVFYYSAFLSSFTSASTAGASGAICGLLGLLIGDMGGTFNDKLRATINTIWPLILIGLLGSGIDNICHFTCLGVGVALSTFYKKR